MKRGEIDALICWHPDRLYRQLKDLVRLFDVATGVEIRTVNGGDLDLSHSTGRMLATIVGSVSTQESEHKSERQRRAARQKAEHGVPHWKRAFGYIDDTREPDPHVAPLVAAGVRGDPRRRITQRRLSTMERRRRADTAIRQASRRARRTRLRRCDEQADHRRRTPKVDTLTSVELHAETAQRCAYATTTTRFCSTTTTTL